MGRGREPAGTERRPRHNLKIHDLPRPVHIDALPYAAIPTLRGATQSRYSGTASEMQHEPDESLKGWYEMPDQPLGPAIREASDDTWEPYEDFDVTIGKVHWIRRDDARSIAFGVYLLDHRTDGVFPPDRTFVYTGVEEYFHVLEGEVEINFVDLGKVITVRTGDSAFIPAESRFRVKHKSPFKEVMVFVPPAGA
jgi:mannose-6-phosphate isomerase-like protein (cupin superfamily)